MVAKSRRKQTLGGGVFGVLKCLSPRNVKKYFLKRKKIRFASRQLSDAKTELQRERKRLRQLETAREGARQAAPAIVESKQKIGALERRISLLSGRIEKTKAMPLSKFY